MLRKGTTMYASTIRRSFQPDTDYILVCLNHSKDLVPKGEFTVKSQSNGRGGF
jgi:hypothetical protein